MKVRKWKLLLPLALFAVGATVAASGAFAGPSQPAPVRLAIMSDCKGAFAFGYELDIGGAQAALGQFAGGVPKNKKKPSAGMTNISAGGADVNIVGYGCGDDTAATALKETRRLMQQLNASVMIGPLSGDEAVAISQWARARPSKTIIIGTAASQDPTMQIAPKNVFRYFGDGAQWNAGIGEILYKKWGWRNVAIMMDDYSFAWTSAAGFITDFCGIGGKITKKVFPPLNTTDYSSYVRQLPSPDDVDGYFWVVGGSGTAASLSAFEQAHGPLKARQHSGNLFLWFLTGAAVAPKLRGAYIGGFGIAPGLQTAAAKKYRAVMAKYYPKVIPAEDSFTLNYYRSAHALVLGLQKSNGRVGAALQRSLPRIIDDPYQVSTAGKVRLDSRRQAIQDQWMMQINPSGKFGIRTYGYVPNVDQTFGGTFGPNKPPPGRNFPACVKKKLPWQGKIKVVANGKVTNQVVKP